MQAVDHRQSFGAQFALALEFGPGQGTGTVLYQDRDCQVEPLDHGHDRLPQHKELVGGCRARGRPLQDSLALQRREQPLCHQGADGRRCDGVDLVVTPRQTQLLAHEGIDHPDQSLQLRMLELAALDEAARDGCGHGQQM